MTNLRIHFTFYVGFSSSESRLSKHNEIDESLYLVDTIANDKHSGLFLRTQSTDTEITSKSNRVFIAAVYESDSDGTHSTFARPTGEASYPFTSISESRDTDRAMPGSDSEYRSPSHHDNCGAASTGYHDEDTADNGKSGAKWTTTLITPTKYRNKLGNNPANQITPKRRNWNLPPLPKPSPSDVDSTPESIPPRRG